MRGVKPGEMRQVAFVHRQHIIKSLEVFGHHHACTQHADIDAALCGGLARTYGLESWVWRLIFVLFVLTFGFGILIYLLLWVFIPEE